MILKMGYVILPTGLTHLELAAVVWSHVAGTAGMIEASVHMVTYPLGRSWFVDLVAEASQWLHRTSPSKQAFFKPLLALWLYCPIG